MPPPCSAWLYHGFASLGCKKLGEMCCLFWVQLTCELWVQPCKGGRQEMSSHWVYLMTWSPPHPRISSHNWAMKLPRDAMKDPFQIKLLLLSCLRSPCSCVLRWFCQDSYRSWVSVRSNESPFWASIPAVQKSALATVCTHCDNPDKKLTYFGFLSTIQPHPT